MEQYLKNFLSNFKSHSLKIKEFIHALVLFLYITGKFSDFIFPKHLGCLDLLIMRGSNFSPVKLAQNAAVIRSLDLFPPDSPRP